MRSQRLLRFRDPAGHGLERGSDRRIAACTAATVHDRERCRAGGLERLLDDGPCRRPRIAELDADERDTGVLLFKPPTCVSGETLLDLDERVAECGHVIAEARLVSAGEMRDRNLCVGSPVAGSWSSSWWRPDNECETDTIV